MPAIDSTIPLLKPGTFRLDLAGFVETSSATNYHPGSMASLQEAFTLGYGVNERLTIFGGAAQANVLRNTGDLVANFVDPKAGFVYRLASAPQLKGVTLDFVGDAAVNAPLRSPWGPGPYGDLGPIFRARLLATKDLGHGFTLQFSGGLFGASVTTPGYAGLPGQSTFDVDALLGLGGQYRLSMISDRLYVNGELDAMRPLTRNEGQILFAAPFRTTESYSATLGASYVLKPGSVILRLTDTAAFNLADENDVLLNRGSKYGFTNTVGATLSFVNLTPQNWLPPLLH